MTKLMKNLLSKIPLALAVASLLLVAGCEPAATPPATNQNANQAPTAPAAPAVPNGKHVATLETNLGTITFELLNGDAPKTSENFIKLAERGYYNNLTFHRVMSGFMIQGGDPQGNGFGGETADGKSLPNEINMSSPIYQRGGYLRGYVAMANKGYPQSASSQFFIMHRDRPFSALQPNYVVFGRVTAGLDVVDKIASVPTTGANRPVTPVVMKKVTITEK